MTNELLLGTYFKYLKIRVEDMPNTENDNFGHLLQYIGKNNDVPKIFSNKFNPIYVNTSKAYDIIQKRTDDLLGIKYLERPTINELILKNKLKTRQKEISSIRYFYNNRRETYAKIPYKVFFIFSAIAAILEEMKNRDNVPPIPDDLKDCIERTYKLAFYHKQIESYNRKYKDFSTEEEIKRELKNDFESPDSPFRIKFGNEA